MAEIVHIFLLVFTIFYIIINCIYLILLTASVPDVLQRNQEIEMNNIFDLMKSKALPPITVVIAAYNEEHCIVDAVKSVLLSDYNNVAIVVVNDGSTDQTLNKLIDEFKLKKVTSIVQENIKTNGKIKGYYISATQKNVVVIDKEHSDRSDTLSIGVNASRTPLFMTFDADSLLTPTAISRMIFYMFTAAQADIIAVGGAVYILNDCKFRNGEMIVPRVSRKPIYTLQTCEYLRAFLFERAGWNMFGGALCYSGTCTIFKREIIQDLGGFEVGNVAQDFEIILRLQANSREHNNAYKIGYTPAAIVWTDAPGSFKRYWRQRYNWQYGTLRSILSYRKMLFNPKYGIIGLFSYPFFLFGETLSPIIQTLCYLLIILAWFLGVLDLQLFGLYMIVSLLFLSFLTMAVAAINFMTFNEYRKFKDFLWIFVFSIIEIIGFQQFHTICRFYATCGYFYDKLKGRI